MDLGSSVAETLFIADSDCSRLWIMQFGILPNETRSIFVYFYFVSIYTAKISRKERTLATPTTTTWALDPQTKAKHEILRSYLGGWYGVMAHTSKRFVFFDAFAGPGIYSDGSPGSPIIALETLLSHAVVARDCEFILLFNESDLARYEHLVALLDQFTVSKPLPTNVKVLKSNQEFIDLGNEISKYFGDAEAALAPTLVFVDPFGVSEVPLVTLQRILSFPKCEVFAYLGVNTINRFGTAGNIDENMEALFQRIRQSFSPRF